MEQIAIVNSRLLAMTVRSDTAAIEDLPMELKAARVKKDAHREDYKQHVRTHGC